jgi:hypothetical protein
MRQSTASLLLVSAFLAALVGGALGASTNSPLYMVLGTLPGIAGIVALMVYSPRIAQRERIEERLKAIRQGLI